MVKKDGNHDEIVAALLAVYAGVVDLSAVGDGVADLLVHMPVAPFDTFLMEIKDGSLPPSHRKLTPAQERFHAEWRGRIVVVTSVNEALAAVGVRTA